MMNINISYHGNQSIRRSEILQKSKKLGVFKSNYLLTAKVYMNDTYSDLILFTNANNKGTQNI